MDFVPVERRPVRSVGHRGPAGTALENDQLGEPDALVVDDSEVLPGFPDDDAWPAHLGAARLGIP